MQTSRWQQCQLSGNLRQCGLKQCHSCAVRTTMGLVGCMARLLTDMRWPLKVLAKLSAFTSTAGKLNPATGLLLDPPCKVANTTSGQKPQLMRCSRLRPIQLKRKDFEMTYSEGLQRSTTGKLSPATALHPHCATYDLVVSISISLSGLHFLVTEQYCI